MIRALKILGRRGSTNIIGEQMSDIESVPKFPGLILEGVTLGGCQYNYYGYRLKNYRDILYPLP